MPRLPGLFDSFDNLDQINVEDIARWLKPEPQFSYIENYLAQRILYPQTIPVTASDMNLDLAILREAVRLSAGPDEKGAMLGSNPFINFTLRKILIPSKFLNFVKDLQTLTWVFTDALVTNRVKKDFFEDLWTVELIGEANETVGSILVPEFNSSEGELQLGVSNKIYKVSAGTLTVVPCKKSRCEVTFRVKMGKILGKDDLSVEVSGGRLGLLIDGRSQ